MKKTRFFYIFPCHRQTHLRKSLLRLRPPPSHPIPGRKKKEGKAIKTVLSVTAITAVFVTLNQIPQIPPFVIELLWYAYIPCLSGAIAFCTGLGKKQSGKGILVAAAVLFPGLFLSVKYALPFSSVFTALPSVIPAALVPIPAEIIARCLKRGKQRKAPAAPLDEKTT